MTPSYVLYVLDFLYLYSIYFVAKIDLITIIICNLLYHKFLQFFLYNSALRDFSVYNYVFTVLCISFSVSLFFIFIISRIILCIILSNACFLSFIENIPNYNIGRISFIKKFLN